MSGRLLRDHCDSIYVLDVVSAADPIPLYRADGSKTFVRHVINALRKNVAVQHEYKVLIKRSGIIKGARAGFIIGVPSVLNRSEMVVHLIAGATLMEALYLAHEESPENPLAFHTHSQMLF